MSPYAEIVKEATGCADRDVPEILDIMRHDIFHSTLDWQTQAQLKRAARQAQQVLAALRGMSDRPTAW